MIKETEARSKQNQKICYVTLSGKFFVKDNILYDIQRRLSPYVDTADLTKEMGF